MSSKHRSSFSLSSSQHRILSRIFREIDNLNESIDNTLDNLLKKYNQSLVDIEQWSKENIEQIKSVSEKAKQTAETIYNSLLNELRTRSSTQRNYLKTLLEKLDYHVKSPSQQSSSTVTKVQMNEIIIDIDLKLIQLKKHLEQTKILYRVECEHTEPNVHIIADILDTNFNQTLLEDNKQLKLDYELNLGNKHPTLAISTENVLFFISSKYQKYNLSTTNEIGNDQNENVKEQTLLYMYDLTLKTKQYEMKWIYDDKYIQDIVWCNYIKKFLILTTDNIYIFDSDKKILQRNEYIPGKKLFERYRGLCIGNDEYLVLSGSWPTLIKFYDYNWNIKRCLTSDSLADNRPCFISMIRYDHFKYGMIVWSSDADNRFELRDENMKLLSRYPFPNTHIYFLLPILNGQWLLSDPRQKLVYTISCNGDTIKLFDNEYILAMDIFSGNDKLYVRTATKIQIYLIEKDNRSPSFLIKSSELKK